MKDNIDELIESEDYLFDDGQETDVATDSLHELVSSCPHCGKEHRLVSHDLCLQNPNYNYITGAFGIACR